MPLYLLRSEHNPDRTRTEPEPNPNLVYFYIRVRWTRTEPEIRFFKINRTLTSKTDTNPDSTYNTTHLAKCHQ